MAKRKTVRDALTQIRDDHRAMRDPAATRREQLLTLATAYSAPSYPHDTDFGLEDDFFDRCSTIASLWADAIAVTLDPTIANDAVDVLVELSDLGFAGLSATGHTRKPPVAYRALEGALDHVALAGSFAAHRLRSWRECGQLRGWWRAGHRFTALERLAEHGGDGPWTPAMADAFVLPPDATPHAVRTAAQVLHRLPGNDPGAEDPDDIDVEAWVAAALAVALHPGTDPNVREEVGELAAQVRQRWRAMMDTYSNADELDWDTEVFFAALLPKALDGPSPSQALLATPVPRLAAVWRDQPPSAAMESLQSSAAHHLRGPLSAVARDPEWAAALVTLEPTFTGTVQELLDTSAALAGR